MEYSSDYNPTNIYGRIVFMSDCCKITYGNVIYFNYGSGSFSGQSQTVYFSESNWNHIVLTYFKLASSNSYTYYYTAQNDQYGGYNYYSYNNLISYSGWTISGSNQVKLSKIVFCSRDDFSNFDEDLFKRECRNAVWVDGFYRRIQIFDLTNSVKQAVFFSHQFEDDGVSGMLKHRFIVGLNTILNNHLIDLVGNGEGYVLSEYNPYITQNPDGANYILYESNFSPEGGISNWGDLNYISGYSYRAPKFSISRGTCSKTSCSLCSSSGTCLACKDGYSLFSRTCKGDVNADAKTASYYYKNPGKNMPDRLSLNMNFNKIMNEPYFTLFFFIKIYGFIKKAPLESPIKLLIFHQERNQAGKLEDVFYLGYHPDGNKEDLFIYIKK